VYVLVFVNYWIEKCTVKHWNWNLSLHALNAYVGLEMQLHLFFSSALGGYEELCTSFPNLVCSLFYICSQHFIIAAAFNINISMWLVWTNCLSQWPRGLRRGSAAARLLGMWVRIPPRAWMFVSCECCVLSGRGLCVGLTTRPEESCRLWCVVVCDLETSWMRRPWLTGGCCAKKKSLNKFLKFVGT